MKQAWLLAGWLLLLGALSVAQAAPPGETGDSSPVASGVAVFELLDQLRVEEAATLLARVPEDDPVRAPAAALFAFYRGDYAAASAALPAEGAREAEIEQRIAWLRKRLSAVSAATRGMAEKAEGHFIYRYRPGPDAILVEYAGKALEGQRAAMSKLFGEQPGLPTVVEFFPDEAGFVAASGLPASWVRTTGTVAICKWDRILVLSPRNLSRGYPWQDTLAHEYVHLALSRASRNQAPVWFHEGSAKLLESAWRDPIRRDFTGPWAESLLARALAEDRLVAFESMHPSMAALPSSELATLAFAQVAWAVQYIFETEGDEGYRRIVAETALHGDLFRAIGAVLGQDERRFEQGYRSFIGEQGLRVRANVAEISLDFEPPAGPSGDPESQRLDPVLQEHRSMQNHARVGDLLRRRGRMRAALLEYERAASVGPFHSPGLANKRARALRGLSRVGEARTVLEESVRLYPEFTPTVALLAELASQEGDHNKAVQMGERAVALNPFDPNVHLLLSASYQRGGRTEESRREQRVLRMIGAPFEAERSKSDD